MKNTQTGRYEEAHETGYFQIFMYYIQTISLLQISIIVSDQNSVNYKNIHRASDLIPSSVLNFINKIFSMDILGVHTAPCLFKNTNAITKTGFQSLFILYFFVILLCMYVFSGCCCVFWRVDRRPFFGNISMNGRIVTTLIALFLYTYQVYNCIFNICILYVHIE